MKFKLQLPLSTAYASMGIDSSHTAINFLVLNWIQIMILREIYMFVS